MSVASPCNKVCVMDPQSGYCRGCRRTLDEIARWGEMSETEQRAVLAQLPARRSDRSEVPVPPQS